MQKLIDKLSKIPYGDKIGHFLLGVLTLIVYLTLFKITVVLAGSSQTIGMYLIADPYTVGFMFGAIMVHAFLELKDLVSKLMGGAGVPSFFDFLSGMAGSIAAYMVVFHSL